jgi:hypothetical protein
MIMSEQPQDGVPWWRNDPCFGGRMFLENRSKFPMEELRQYNRQYVAWIPDGSGIHDSDTDPIALRDRIRESGDEPAMFHIEYISDETYI